jgi:hypothetical protein
MEDTIEFPGTETMPFPENYKIEAVDFLPYLHAPTNTQHGDGWTEEHKTELEARLTDALRVRVSKPHWNSNAIGVITSNDRTILIVKDRDEHESRVQTACFLMATVLAEAFRLPPNMMVAASQGIDRPPVESLTKGSIGYVLWHLKEETWAHMKERIDELPDDPEDLEYRPSEYECWQLEEAATFHDDSMKTTQKTIVSSLIDDVNDADASLRRKLRRAAGRSSTGCLDLFQALCITEQTQDLIINDEEWNEYYKKSILPNPADALTAIETKLLLEEKLSGHAFEASLLYTVITAQPSVSAENMALREIAKEDGSWSLAWVNVDTGTVPAHGGTSLESLKCFEKGEEDGDLCETNGNPECNGYYYPMPLLLNAAKNRLSLQGRQGLSRLDASRLRLLIEDQYKDLGWDMTKLGLHAEKRVKIMQSLLYENEEVSLESLCFAACPAWKRDLSDMLEGDTGEWFAELKAWANVE